MGEKIDLVELFVVTCIPTSCDNARFPIHCDSFAWGEKKNGLAQKTLKNINLFEKRKEKITIQKVHFFQISCHKLPQNLV